MEYASFLGLPKLTHDNTMFCEGNLTEKELFDSMITTLKNRLLEMTASQLNFFNSFDIITLRNFLNSINWSQMKKEFSVSQKQAIIKLIEEKGKDKRYIKNWRPVSLLNVDNNIV